VFTIDQIPDDARQEILMSSANKSIQASIELTQGARVKFLTYNNNLVIGEAEDKPYEESFASSVLFPFANRVCNGQYSISNLDYQLNCNEKGRNNALHGLIYNKTFEIQKHHHSDDIAWVSVRYEEQNPPAGFPFPFAVTLKYSLTDSSLKIEVGIKNIGQKNFPFTLGWHPYFQSSSIEKSRIGLQSDRKIIHNPDLIAIGTSASINEGIALQNIVLDDCFILKSRPVTFVTPDYSAELISDQRFKYLQIYKPLEAKSVAIEPMSGISDSFNNKLGLQVLEPNAVYNTTWQINLYQ
jgi:aldose 1-epimerase